MKKILLGLVAAAALLATSCDKNLQEGPVAADGTAKVSVNLNFPKMQTRAYSDGTTATQLQYAVYEKGTSNLSLIEALTHSVIDETAETIHISKQIDFQLVTGRTYVFVFWAAGEDAPYEVKFANNGATMTADYDSVEANDENLDAFFANIEKTITGDVQMTVELTRPFAQINVGTSDYEIAEELGCAPDLSQVVISEVYTELDLMTGQVSEPEENVTFAYANIDTEESFPVPGYEYLAMTYMLASAEESVVEVTFDYKEGENGEAKSRKVGSVPVKRNHRTNLYGQVLTSNASLNIIIKPDYEEPDYNYSQLLFAAAVGGTAVLEDDVDLNDHGDVLTFTKDAVIDLNGKTITGLNGKNGAISVTNGANVTIKGNGKIISTDATHSTVVWVYDENSSVTIEDGYFEGEGTNDQLIYCEKGTIYINGGTFKLPDYNYTLNCKDPNAKNGTAKFVVTGGKFWKYDPSGSIAEGKDPTYNWVAPGYKSVKTTIDGDDNWYVVIPADTEMVTTDNAQDVFNSLVTKGGNAILSEDITVSSVAFKDDTHIDLNGKKLTIKTDYSATYDEGVEVAFENGTIEFTQAQFQTQSDVVIKAGGSLTINNATIISNAAGIITQGEGAVLTITNSEFESYNYCITTNATWENGDYRDGKNATINLSGSTFKSQNSVVILNNVPNTFNVDNCTFVGNSQAVFMRVGTATFTDTIFKLNSNFTSNPCRLAVTSAWGSGNMATIAALVIGNYDTKTYSDTQTPSYNDPASVTLKGKTTIVVNGTKPELYPAIHVASANNNRVDFNYVENDVEINDYNYSLSEHKIEFATGNIYVNGTEVKPNISAE